MEHKICLEYRTLVDIKFTTRHCKLDECEFGCCHDYAALLEIIEKRLGYNFGKVQHQSKVTKGRRYQCISHSNCKVYVRIHHAKDKSHMFAEMSTAYEHSSNVKTDIAGIHPIWIKEVDKLAPSDLSATRILQHLVELSKSDVELVNASSFLPSKQQIQSRMNYIVSKRNESTTKDFLHGDLIEYFKTHNTWKDGNGKYQDLASDDVLTVDFIDELPGVLHKKDETIALTFTSKAMVENLKGAIESTNNNLPIFSDGTFKITNRGWVLLVIGTITLRVCDDKNHTLRHSFRPLMFCLCSSESHISYELCYRSMNTIASHFLGINNINIAYSMQDGSPSAPNALDEVYTLSKYRYRHATCWFHLMQNVKSKTKFLFVKNKRKKCSEDHDMISEKLSHLGEDDMIATVVSDSGTTTTTQVELNRQIYKQIYALHFSQSPNAFQLLSENLKQMWSVHPDDKIRTWATSFINIYIENSLFRNWFIGNSLCRIEHDPQQQVLLAFTNNAVESFNAALKLQVTLDHKPQTFLAETIPNICRMVGNSIYSSKYIHVAFNEQIKWINERSIPKNYLLDAWSYVTAPSSFHIVTETSLMYINANHKDKTPVTHQRIQQYENATHETMDATNITWDKLSYQMSGLYRVSPICREVNQVIRCVCTCKDYVFTSYVCSHVLVMLNNLKLFSLQKLFTEVATGQNKKKRKISSDAKQDVAGGRKNVLILDDETQTLRSGVAHIGNSRDSQILVSFYTTDCSSPCLEFIDKEVVAAGIKAYDSSMEETIASFLHTI
jgi:hypothetical protein